MKKFTFIFAFIFLAYTSFGVDIIGHFNTQSTGKYLPYSANGTLNISFDFEVQDGPATNFKIGFYLSTDLIITTSDYLIGEFTIPSANTGSSAFPSQFGQAAPYQIKQLLTISGIPHNTTLFCGVLLDKDNSISESDETNNSGTINMPPMALIGNVNITLSNVSKQLNIYPNPIHDFARISGDIHSDNLTIKVYNIFGSLVDVHQNVALPFIWNRAILENGIYFMAVELNNKAIIRKKIILF